SATEARLLALLTSAPGQELHTRELVRRIGGTPRPVQLALEKLSRQGLIESRRVGPLRLWRMDPAHPLYRSLRELYARTVGVGARIAAVVAKQRGVDLAFVFGSYARGTDDLRSDIDVFVLGDADWGPLEDVARELSKELAREVNFVSWKRADLSRAVEQASPFLDTLRRSEKIWIKGDDDELERRLTSVGREVRKRRPAVRRGRPRAAQEARARKAQPRAGSRRARER
ncbi:MAG TPA: nucleotidyltransferase domain-containing protein, partial [Candidatus Limnocylindria bacterium]|nr:nucleotidyltransferase domain-containing protein [Candidatus Limnocylindria bacterium]